MSINKMIVRGLSPIEEIDRSVHQGDVHIPVKDDKSDQVEKIYSMLSRAEKPVLKARISLLEQEFIEEMAKVMHFGTFKYSEEDWRDNDAVKVKERLDSLGRHFSKCLRTPGLVPDSEHGCSEFASIAVNAMICWWIAKYRQERDNRWIDKASTK